MKIAKVFFLIAIIGILITAIIWAVSDEPTVQSRGVLNIDGRTEIEPGVWSIEIPFELRNVSLDENVYTVRLEPGQSGEIMVKIKEQGQGQVQVELAAKVSLGQDYEAESWISPEYAPIRHQVIPYGSGELPQMTKMEIKGIGEVQWETEEQRITRRDAEWAEIWQQHLDGNGCIPNDFDLNQAIKSLPDEDDTIQWLASDFPVEYR